MLNSINLNKQTKRQKYLCILGNKSLELLQIFNLPKVVFQLPDKLKSDDSNPIVTYQVGKTIRNKILNYKKAINSIHVDEMYLSVLVLIKMTVLILPSVILIRST